MRLTELRIRDFRVIRELELAGGHGIHLITGRNAAGKTSLIEAVYVAGRGRSFRHREVRPWIRDGQHKAFIFVRTEEERGTRHQIGLEQTRKGKAIRVDGEPMTRRSQLARIVPLQLITPTSHELIEKGPSGRRRFVDWGLFHVEPPFYETAYRFRRLLMQRNAALRKGDRSYQVWDVPLAEAGETLDAMRRRFLPALGVFLSEELAKLGQGPELELLLKSGWTGGDGLLSALKNRRAEDEARGQTSVGPHRSRIEILVQGRPAERHLSRGQQKLLIFALYFGLCRLVRERTNEAPIFLIDDLPAELDSDNRLTLMERLTALQVQAFVTGIAFDPIVSELATKVFHVEQGVLGEA